MLREFRVAGWHLLPTPPRRSQATLAAVSPRHGASPWLLWRRCDFGSGTCTAKRAPTHFDGAGPGFFDGCFSPPQCMSQAPLSAVSPRRGASPWPLWRLFLPNTAQVPGHSGDYFSPTWRRSLALLAAISPRHGAGVFLGGGPAPQNGLLRTSMAQVLTLFPHLRQSSAPPAPKLPYTCANHRYHLRQNCLTLAPKIPYTCANHRHHLRHNCLIPAPENTFSCACHRASPAVVLPWQFGSSWQFGGGPWGANSPKCRTGGRVLRARLGGAVRQVPISASGAPQPPTQSTGRGLLCACLAAGRDGGPAFARKISKKPELLLSL